MNRLEKVLYTASVYTSGRRAGVSRSSDGRLEVRLSRPGSPGIGTNPEQLLAAGWSACFESAMEFAARNMKITLPADHAVDAEIDLGPEEGAFSLAARLYVSLPGMERATAQRLARRPTKCVPIRGQRTGTSPSKRRWSEAAPMRADSDRLIAGGVGHIFARKPRRPSRKPWSTLPVSEAAGLAAAIRPSLPTGQADKPASPIFASE